MTHSESKPFEFKMEDEHETNIKSDVTHFDVADYSIGGSYTVDNHKLFIRAHCKNILRE